MLTSAESGATISQEPAGAGLNRVVISDVTFDERAEFRLHMLFDVFLFEITALEAALLQLVNVVFRFGVDIRDIDLSHIVPLLQRQASAYGCPTPLESWRAQRSDRDSGLWWLFELRNATTHRKLLELNRIMPSLQIGPDAPTTGRVRMEYWLPTRTGGREPLAVFLDRTVQGFGAMLDRSFDDLLSLLQLHRGTQ